MTPIGPARAGGLSNTLRGATIPNTLGGRGVPVSVPGRRAPAIVAAAGGVLVAIVLVLATAGPR